MIYARLPENKQQELEILSSMPEFKDASYSFLCGLWKDNKYIGGILIYSNTPGFIALQWKNTGDPTLGIALSDIFEMMFNKYSRIRGRVHLLNAKSLKVGKQLGFYNLYKEDCYQVLEVSRETWKLKRKTK